MYKIQGFDQLRLNVRLFPNGNLFQNKGISLKSIKYVIFCVPYNREVSLS